MFQYTTNLRMGQTDAAGIIYFARLFDIAHEAYEALLDSLGIPLGDIVHDVRFGLPIVHAEADYTAAIRVGDRLNINVVPTRVGKSSFTLSYKFFNAGDKEVGSVQTVHVSIDPKSQKAIPLPLELKEALLTQNE